jgi:hypothetical protein
VRVGGVLVGGVVDGRRSGPLAEEFYEGCAVLCQAEDRGAHVYRDVVGLCGWKGVLDVVCRSERVDWELEVV